MARATSEEVLARKEAELAALRKKIAEANQLAAEKNRETKVARLGKLREREERQRNIVQQAEDNLGKTQALIAELERELGVEPDTQ